MRARAVFFTTVAILFAGSACTLLVNFVDEPDASIDASNDVAIDAIDASDADAAEAGYDASKVCKGLDDGWYCGFNGLNGDPPASWLVHCIDSGATVRVCDAGCLAFPSGTSDRCNECPGMPDGIYCGSQFSTYATDNAAYLITCGGGVAAIQTKCANGCASGPGDASCK